MRLTDEQLEILSAWEQNFDTAIRAKWALNPGSTALETINNIWNAATGEGRRLNPGCSTCIFNLLKDAGQLYFQEKQARLDAANDKKAVELSEKEAKPVKKVAISTQQREKKKKERQKKE